MWIMMLILQTAATIREILHGGMELAGAEASGETEEREDFRMHPTGQEAQNISVMAQSG